MATSLCAFASPFLLLRLFSLRGIRHHQHLVLAPTIISPGGTAWQIQPSSMHTLFPMIRSSLWHMRIEIFNMIHGHRPADPMVSAEGRHSTSSPKAVVRSSGTILWSRILGRAPTRSYKTLTSPVHRVLWYGVRLALPPFNSRRSYPFPCNERINSSPWRKFERLSATAGFSRRVQV